MVDGLHSDYYELAGEQRCPPVFFCLYHHRFKKLLVSKTGKLLSQIHSFGNQLVMVCDLNIAEKVKMESPEIFRVLGKRRPEFVIPYIEQLQKMAEMRNS